MPMFSPSKAGAVFALLLTLMAALCVRAAWLAAAPDSRILALTDRQHHRIVPIPARRGTVFDRHMLVMAGTVQTRTVFVDPAFLIAHYQQPGRSLTELDDKLLQLSAMLDLDSVELLQQIEQRPDRRFLRLAEHLGDDADEHIRRIGLAGVGVLPASQRHYPMGSVAAHVLGGVRSDQAGLEGIEQRFEAMLAGRNGHKRTLTDSRGREVRVDPVDYLPPVHGRHLVLTIDANIQMMAERQLAAACEASRAKRGEVVVIDPHTGQILALANYPSFSPQNPQDSPQEVRLNRAVVVPYEPGSTLKPFLVGPALMWRVTRPEQVWHVPTGPLVTSYGRRVNDVHSYGDMTTWDILGKSSNKGMSMIAQLMGQARMHKALTMLGFGSPSGIELPGEHPGRVNPLRRWTRYSTESIAQGYEMMLTPLQLARAFCAYANGGKLISPRIVLGSLDNNGELAPTEAHPAQQVVDPAAALMIRSMLTDAVIRGTGTKAHSKTWNFFGKTGTAHISQGAAGYNESSYTSSFVGGGPAESPRVVLAMIIHEPDRSIAHFGGTVSAPYAGALLSELMAYWRVPASPRPTPPPAAVWPNIIRPNHRLYAPATHTTPAPHPDRS